MVIELDGEDALTVRDLDTPGMDVRARDGGHAHFGPIPMFAASLALCTASVLLDYGETIGASTEGLEIGIRWAVLQHPNRVDDLRMEIRWPGVPESRREAARRAAEQCTIHHTLERPTAVQTVLVRESPELGGARSP